MVIPVIHPDTGNNAQVEWGVLLYGGSLVVKSCPTLETPLTVGCKAPLSLGFSRQEYCNGLPFPCPGDLPNLGIKPGSPALQMDSLPTELSGKPYRKVSPRFELGSLDTESRVLTITLETNHKWASAHFLGCYKCSIPGEGHGNPLQYSCLENLMDRDAQWTIVHRVTKSWLQLK